MDTALEALADGYRRRLLAALLEHNPQHVENTYSPADVATEDAAPLVTSITHVHLPKLADAGFVEWDRENHEIRRGRSFEEISPLLQLMLEHADELPDNWI